MTVFVTGAAGFVGQWLLRALLERGDEVFGLSITGPPRAGVLTQEQIDRVRWLSGDLRRPDDIDAALSASRPQHIYHLAAISFVPEAASDPASAFEVNAVGAVRLLHAMARSGAKNKAIRVLIVGSGEQYGRHEQHDYPLAESSPQHPLTVYAASKAAQEIACLQLWRSGGPEVVLTRSFNHSGPGQDPRFLLPSLVGRAAQIRSDGSTILRLGNTTPVRDFLHVSDVVAAYVMLCERGAAGQVYNVCSGEGRTVREIAETVLRVGNVRATIDTDPDLVRPVDLPTLVGNNAKLRSTGWRPVLTFDDIVADLWKDVDRN